MENPKSRFTVAERLIRKLRDVASCEIQTAPDGSIEVIHVTARPGRTPKQIARDIESILAAEENIRVDHRKISIAQYGEGALSNAEATLDRVVVAGLSLHQSGAAFEAEVTLSSGDVSATGQAAGSNTRGESRRMIAQATLDAITKLTTLDPRFSLGELEERDLGSRRILLVCVNQVDGREERNFVGCCEVGTDPARAVVYAVLDAVNRVVSTLPPREPVEYEIGPTPLA
jgi:hypothetical protein